MDDLMKFQHSSDKLMEFLRKWAKPLSERCENNNASSQQKASYYLWARYSMSIKTIKQIFSVEFFPDICVICRCCLEVSASLQAVLSDEQEANNYLEFEKHSKSNHIRCLKYIGKTKEAVRLEKHLSEFGIESIDNYKSKCWYKGGYSKLVKDHKGPDERELYFFFSDFTHSSVNAIRTLQNLQAPPNLLESLVKLVYSDYICSTKSFLDKTWGEIVTGDSEKCKMNSMKLPGCFVDLSQVTAYHMGGSLKRSLGMACI
jgi:hypothetical protein